jgi:hypothetical protein
MSAKWLIINGVMSAKISVIKLAKASEKISAMALKALMAANGISKRRKCRRNESQRWQRRRRSRGGGENQ